MKIRDGFVSNSSSSSFFIIVDKQEFQDKLGKLGKVEQAFIKSMFKSKKFMDKDVMISSYFSDMGGECMSINMGVSWNPGNNPLLEKNWDFIEEKYEGDVSEIYIDFVDSLAKNKCIQIDESNS